MSLHFRRPLIDTLRDVLHKMEADTETDIPNLVELKQIIRERIASIEGGPRSPNPGSVDSPLASHQNRNSICPEPDRVDPN